MLFCYILLLYYFIISPSCISSVQHDDNMFKSCIIYFIITVSQLHWSYIFQVFAATVSVYGCSVSYYSHVLYCRCSHSWVTTLESTAVKVQAQLWRWVCEPHTCILDFRQLLEGDSLDKTFASQLLRIPLLAILGSLPDTDMNRKKTDLLHILLTAARKAITLNWLKKDPPTLDIWQSVENLHHGKDNFYVETPKRTELYLFHCHRCLCFMI